MDYPGPYPIGLADLAVLTEDGKCRRRKKAKWELRF